MQFLTKTWGGRKRTASGRDRKSRNRGPTGETGGEGGPDEAAAFIAETVTELAPLAGRHKLGILDHLLEMVRLEAEDHLRLRSKRKLSRRAAPTRWRAMTARAVA